MAKQKVQPISDFQMSQIVSMRNNRVHISSIMLIQIINKIKSKTGTAYLGEIYAYYLAESKKKNCTGIISYTEAGIRAHLKTLENKEYILITREGMFNKYQVTLKGLMSIRGMF